MGIEIEAKMKLGSIAELEDRLSRLGGVRGAVVHEVNTFFDTPAGALKASDQGLRLRVEREESSDRVVVTVTHKGPRARGPLKSRAEAEVRVDDAGAGAAFLAALGFTPLLTFEKRRRRWMLDACHVDIDTLPYLGDFVEIEGPGEAPVLALREKLGMNDQALIQASYIALVMDYLAQHRISDRHVRLGDVAPPVR